MSHKWEHEDEYLKLDSEYHRAQKDGDISTVQRIKPRLDELNQIMWQSITKGFPELISYSSLVEALEQIGDFPRKQDLRSCLSGVEDPHRAELVAKLWLQMENQ